MRQWRCRGSMRQRALEMLEQCDAPAATDYGVEDIRGVAARRIFKRYWEATGIAGLGKLRRAADHPGETGQYPYGAMTPVIEEVSRQNAVEGMAMISDAFAFLPPRLAVPDGGRVLYCFSGKDQGHDAGGYAARGTRSSGRQVGPVTRAS
ncbi:MAG TPA: hypothetical protein VKB77_13190 [Terriglobales bacterium]|nr:hypothetical protein [Terriglobales bacterium]